jgi:hypothetical protein
MIRQERPLPTYLELWDRLDVLDDVVCDYLQTASINLARIGSDRERQPEWKWVVEDLGSILAAVRGGDQFCPDCDHINAIWHSCADWQAYDGGEIDNDEVGRRHKAFEESLRSGNLGTKPVVYVETSGTDAIPA